MTLFKFLQSSSIFRSHLLAFTVSAALLSPGGHAAPANDSEPQFEYSTQASTPVIEYTLNHEMLAEADAEPLLRIYGNGRVHVHVPVYMKNAGDYELHLNRNELDAFVSTLSRDGVIDFDRASTREKLRRLKVKKRATNGTLWEVSDVTETVIQVNLNRYQRNAASTPVKDLKKRFTWKSLQMDSRRYPESNEVQRAAASAQMLHAVIRRPDLKRMNR